MDQDSNKFEIEDEEIKELLKEALKIELSQRKKKNSQTVTEVAISSCLKEFMSNFVVIGYDLDGKAQVIRHAKTQLDNDGLNTLVMRYMSMLINQDRYE